MKAWFLALSERERYLLVIGGIVLLAVVLWFYAWTPLLKYKQRLQEDVQAAAEDLTSLQQAQAQIASLQAAAASQQPVDTTTGVQLLIAPVLQKYQLDQAGVLVRSEAKGKDGVNVKLENAQFDQLVNFLGELETQYAIYVTSMALVPADAPGLAGVQLTLER